tara:strand:+ start:187 stop:1206 length:1020 start_codon:yes stop_codon:yes gene_type:complete
MRFFLTSLLTVVFNLQIIAQGCCSGGAGSPIAGGAATGVLQEYQMELSINFQNNSSNKFYTKDEGTDPLFNNLKTNYLFFRTDYGVTKKLTISLAAGYYQTKSLEDDNESASFSSKGFGDFIIFPRYSVYNKNTNFKRTEIAIGIGMKIPLGTDKDSTLKIPASSWNPEDIYQINPPTVQTTTGSNDLMLYSFLFREYQKRKLRLFMTTLYMKKSYNSLGIKFGDYASLGLFVSKTVFRKWAVTTQLKLEHVDKIQSAKNIDLLASYSIDANSTGSNKAFFIPQLSYSNKGITVFATSEIPVYQYLHGTQIGSQNQFTFGVNYRFLTKEYESETFRLLE